LDAVKEPSFARLSRASCLAGEKGPSWVARQREGIGGDGGIRTLDRPLQAYNGLANRRLQPLGHVSNRADMPEAAASRKRQMRGCPEELQRTSPVGCLPQLFAGDSTRAGRAHAAPSAAMARIHFVPENSGLLRISGVSVEPELQQNRQMSGLIYRVSCSAGAPGGESALLLRASVARS
jgi:hypothetical protein